MMPKAMQQPAPVVFHNSRNSLARSDEGILTAVVGVEDIVVVDDARCRVGHVARQGRGGQRARRATQGAESSAGRKAFTDLSAVGLLPGRGHRWRYQVKRIVVKPNAKLSLQKHFHRAEHWVVVRRDRGSHRRDRNRDVVHENKSTYIPIGSVHRLANPGKIPLELIEVQVGSYLGEDDIVRLTDEYGRD